MLPEIPRGVAHFILVDSQRKPACLWESVFAGAWHEEAKREGLASNLSCNFGLISEGKCFLGPLWSVPPVIVSCRCPLSVPMSWWQLSMNLSQPDSRGYTEKLYPEKQKQKFFKKRKEKKELELLCFVVILALESLRKGDHECKAA